MNVQRSFMNPIFACRRLALICAVGGFFAVGACSGDDKDEAEGITKGDDDKPGVSPENSDKPDGSSSDNSAGPVESGLPDFPETPKTGDNGPGEGNQPEEGAGELPCEIDFLFVIDHSGSMNSEQENLKESVPEFIETVTKEIDELEDYHIGVVTTGPSNFGQNFGSPGCDKIGALLTRTSGQNSSNQACGPYANKKKFMTNDDDLDDKFVCAAKPGTGGSGDEKPMDAMVAAVSKELNTAECNAGFLREEALLVVTIITDEEDDQTDAQGSTGSKGDPKDWYDALVEAKGGDPKNVVVLGLIGTEKDNVCDPLLGPEENLQEEGAQISKRLAKFVKMFKKNGVIGDVCAENYGEFFRKAVGVIDLACEEKPPV